LPKSWDETYEKALLNIDAEMQEYAQRLFQCLTVSIRPLRVDELAEILAIRFNSDSIPNYNAIWRSGDAKEAVLSACSSLITVANVDESLVVQFSHFSVKEFLTSERLATMGSELSRYHILPGPAHTVMAKACLSILFMLDDSMDKKTIKNFPLALYAARHWIEHAQFDDLLSHIQVVIFRLFDSDKPHFRAWIWLYDPDCHWGNHMSTPHPTRPQASPLYYAALYGFRDVVEHLVDAHLQDLNARSGTRGTPLHAALDGRHQTVAMLLVERGADIGCLDFQSRTPLHIACCGCTDVVSVLIDRGVDLNAEDDSRETPLHDASQWGCDDIIRLLLDHGAEAGRLDRSGWTPLHVASHEGHDKIVQLLFDHGADANRPDNGGWTPLHLASWEGREHIVRFLLDHGITVNRPDNGGWTPLHAASQEGHNHSVELLLNHGADSNYPNSDGSTPLHLASQMGHDNTVRLLLHYGAITNRLNDAGWASLHLASQRGHYDVVGLLLEHDADSNHAHSNGLTPLHLASQEGHDNIVRLLLNRGAYTNSLNSDGCTPKYLASQRGHDHIVRLLLEHGAEADHPSSDNSDNLTPMGFASREGGVERKPPEGFAIATRTRRRV
jgi:ankyrin repeat protein